jgi:hypothetical protein
VCLLLAIKWHLNRGAATEVIIRLKYTADINYVIRKLLTPNRPTKRTTMVIK